MQEMATTVHCQQRVKVFYDITLHKYIGIKDINNNEREVANSAMLHLSSY